MKSVIVGAGTYGTMYMAYLQEVGVEVFGFLDDNPSLENTDFMGVPILGKTDLLPKLKELYGVDTIYCPLGNNELRTRFLSEAQQLGYNTPNFIQTLTPIGPYVEVDERGVYMLANHSTIMPYCKIEKSVMLSANIVLGHHVHLHEGAFVSNGVNFGGNVDVGEGAWIGVGARVINGVKIGKWATVGAGAVVIKDVPDYAIVAGVPAKVLRYKERQKDE